MHGNKTLIIHKGKEAHDELAVHSIRDAAVTGDRFAEILDLEGSFQAGGKEAAKRRDEGGEGGEEENMKLHGCDMNGPRKEPQRRESIRVWDEDWVRSAVEAGEDVGAEILKRESAISIKVIWSWVGGAILHSRD